MVSPIGLPRPSIMHWSDFDFLSLLDGIVVSGVEKVKKPDSRIYQILLTRYSLNPAECLFLDDREENLRAAALQGMQVELIV